MTAEILLITLLVLYSHLPLQSAQPILLGLQFRAILIIDLLIITFVSPLTMWLAGMVH